MHPCSRGLASCWPLPGSWSVQAQSLGRAEGSIREQGPRSGKCRIGPEGQELLLTCKHSAQGPGGEREGRRAARCPGLSVRELRVGRTLGNMDCCCAGQLGGRVSHRAQPHPMPPTLNPAVLNLWVKTPLANLYLQRYLHYNS